MPSKMIKKKKVGAPQKYQDIKKFQAIIDKYFKDCLSRTKTSYLKGPKGHPIKFQIPNPRPFTITGLALALGTTRQELINIEHEYQYPQLFVDSIRKAKLRCYNFTEESLWLPKVAQGVIFSLKNNFGWKDMIEITGPGQATMPRIDIKIAVLDKEIAALEGKTGIIVDVTTESVKQVCKDEGKTPQAVESKGE